MNEKVTLIIDQQPVSVAEGTTILKAAEQLGISIPTLCVHEACTANGLCRVCVVEVEGSRALVASCKAQVTEGMRVSTDSERVQRARRTILEMLYSSVDLSDAPEIQHMAASYQANPARFPDATPRRLPILDDNPMYIRDYSKCILCWRCVQVCAEDAQYTYAINFGGRGYETQISTFFDIPLPESTCVFCGQCVGVCPSGALKPKREYLLESGLPPEEIIELTKPQKGRRRRAEQE